MIITNEKILNYKAVLEVKGPLFIGSGETIEKSEYIINGSRVYVMDSFKMFNGLRKKGLLKKYQDSVISMGSGFNMSSFVRINNITVSEYKNWAAYSYNNEDKDNLKITQIKAFIKDPYNMLYVPGSSIKGALRTAYENYYFSMFKTEKRCARIRNAVYERDYKKALSIENKDAGVSAFNKLEMMDSKPRDAINDIFRGIRISDSKPISVENLILCSKCDVKLNGKEAKPNIQSECIKPGTKIEFNIEIIPEYFKIKKGDDEGFETAIYNIINKAYVIQKKYFLSEFPNVQNGGKNSIYIGGGSGFVSKTVLHSIFKDKKECAEITSEILGKMFKNNRGDYKKYGISPHTRKCTSYNKKRYDFGLCELTLIPAN